MWEMSVNVNSGTLVIKATLSREDLLTYLLTVERVVVVHIWLELRRLPQILLVWVRRTIN